MVFYEVYRYDKYSYNKCLSKKQGQVGHYMTLQHSSKQGDLALIILTYCSEINNNILGFVGDGIINRPFVISSVLIHGNFKALV